MKSKIKILEKRIDEIKKDYEILTLLEMQEKYNVSESTILKLFKKYNITKRKDFTDERVGQKRINNQGFTMEVITYNNRKDIEVKFYDNNNTIIKTNWDNFDKGITQNSNYRLGEENISNEGYLMKIICYNSYLDIIVEFQDKYHAQIHTEYKKFKSGEIKNPYHPSIFGIGITGNRYPVSKNNKSTKEYNAWWDMLKRCFSIEYKQKNMTYQEVICCDEWLLYDNFYKWLHSQDNIDKWLNSERSAIDKDILVKGNKIYSPETCCLVPNHVNSLFVKQHKTNSNLPVGIRVKNNRFEVQCSNYIIAKKEYLGTYDTLEEAFCVYKTYKERLIKQVAEIEYSQGNISKQCYDAMMTYKVEITD